MHSSKSARNDRANRTPEHRSVVEDYDHSQQVPAGAWTLSVGGGQPAASGGLHGRISNQGRGPLAKCGK